MFRWLAKLIVDRARKRPPDYIIGGKDKPYLLRWWVLPRNPFFNLYVHEFKRSDDDRALHDHPWFWLSYIVEGGYVEHTIAAGGVHRRREYLQGALRLHSPWRAHRLEINGICRTLFFTGPTLRVWGFHCQRGWRRWQDFVSARDKGDIGRGCD